MYVESLHAELESKAIFFQGSYCDYNPTQHISPGITSANQKRINECMESKPSNLNAYSFLTSG